MVFSTFTNDGSAEADYESNRRTAARDFMPKLKRVINRIPFASDMLAAYYAALDRKTPMKVRAMILAAIAYFILPMDAVPDVLAGLGYTDDAAVFFATFKLIASSITQQHRDAAREWLAENEVEASAS